MDFYYAVESFGIVVIGRYFGYVVVLIFWFCFEVSIVIYMKLMRRLEEMRLVFIRVIWFGRVGVGV